MRISGIKIAGFRGFNEERSIIFHDKLTVISAPNSHGKTSISEALEFLLYGSTSKVDKADAKDEYKDSYRNRHFPSDKPAYIEAVMVVPQGDSKVLRVELDESGTTRRYIDGTAVSVWSFESESNQAGRPFVLQHALKNLLLVPPVDRFKGFAQLLGLNEVDNISRALVSLCTKPNASVPDEAVALEQEFDRIKTKLSLTQNLKNVAVELEKGKKGIEHAYVELAKYADTLLSAEPESSGTKVERLERVRASMASKVYSGEITVKRPSVIDREQLSEYRTVLTLETEPRFLDDYASICVAGVEARLQKEASLLQIGSDLVVGSDHLCPLCLQPLDAAAEARIHSRHTECQATIEKETGRKESRERVSRTVRNLRNALTRHQNKISEPILGLVIAIKPENESRIIELVGGIASETAKNFRSAASAASALQLRLNDSLTEVEHALTLCESALKENKAELIQAENLARVLHAYVSAADEVSANIPQLEIDTIESVRIFRRSIDALAGTAEITVLIEAIEKQDVVKRGAAIRDVLNDLKLLKRDVEQTLAETMENMMSKELTDLVMSWYTRIKTNGDPEVHFSGFSMARSKTGDFKSGKLAIKAESYGKPLASAVSSLSESKLNALGLCVSIASAIRHAGPWDFLLIDDPIQSWDDEHEGQFVNVLRDLIDDEGKQIIVLTHKSDWANRVCDGCRSINGNLYEITGYAKDGPQINQLEWATLENRLKEVNAIITDKSAPSVRVQQAEEELRHIACQLAERIALKKLGRSVSAHKMNSTSVRGILISAGAPVKETDELYAVHSASDDSHHGPERYQARVQRVRVGLAAIYKIKDWLET